MCYLRENAVGGRGGWEMERLDCCSPGKMQGLVDVEPQREAWVMTSGDVEPQQEARVTMSGDVHPWLWPLGWERC